MSALSRRGFALGLPLAACSRTSRQRESAHDVATTASVPVQAAVSASSAEAGSPDGSAGRTSVTVIEWDLGARGHAVVLLSPAKEGQKLPLVIALHGRGESLKGPARGAWGWPRDYALERAMTRIEKPPLSRADFEWFVTDERLQRINADLATKPFGGLAIVSPFLPDFDWSRPPQATVDDYGKFIVEELVPKARKELPVIASPAATGIDGVSLGGCMALRVGFRHATEFGAVGSLQGALNPGQVPELVQMATAAKRKNERLALRVATSKDDGFVNSNHALSAGLRAAGVAHRFEDHLGPHDYPWNRGPGSYELLLFHDAALARS